MAGWLEHKGRALVLDIDNVDTDQLIPARFMSTPRSAGYADYLLYDLRRDANGTLKPDFPLNLITGASVLISGQNFGTGSSREAAVYALVDFGFKAVIAPSFGDIFEGNAVNNGLLPIRMSLAAIDQLRRNIVVQEDAVKVSLESQTVSVREFSEAFEIVGTWKLKLQNGWDDIDLTLQNSDRIAAFGDARRETRTWSWPFNVR